MSTWHPATSTQCVLKWVWSTVYLFNGMRTASCFKNPFEHLDSDSFSNFHNTERKINDRKLMLEGQWPNGCESCRIAESKGAESDRTFHNRYQHLVNKPLIENSLIATPHVVEVYFRNTCNMSCVYCSSVLSSKWQSEMQQYGDFHNGNVSIKNSSYNENNYTEILETFCNWLRKELPNIRELNILGGEPFLINELDRVIELVDETPSENLFLTIVSNLNIPTELFTKKVAMLEQLLENKKLHRIKVNASIDGWGSEIEFQRWGLNLDQFEKNMQRLLSSKLDISINVTFTSIGIPALPALMKKWVEWNQVKPVGFSGIRVEHRNRVKFLEVEVLPHSITIPALEQSLNIIADDKFKDARLRIEIIKDFIEKFPSTGDEERIKDLEIYLNEISRRRNTDWKDYYPWLEGLLNVVR